MIRRLDPLWIAAVLVFAGMFSTACDDTNTPTAPPDDTPAVLDYALVQGVLQEDCGSCHGANSGRAFLVSMDEATLVASGFITPAEPLKSLILSKPRNATGHGGGVVTGFTDEDILAISEWIALQPIVNLNVLSAMYVGPRLKPNSDGYASEEVWSMATTMVAVVGGGWADAEDVTLSAAYDDEYLYILARWVDDEASYRRDPWVKQADGTWKAMSAKPRPEDGIGWQTYMGASFDEEGPTLFYEDKFAMIWNTYGASTVEGFDEQGCSVVCHDPTYNYSPGTTYNYTDQQLAAKKYTNATNEKADMWHWKSVRQNQHYKVDDQHVRYWAQGDDDPAHAGRKADSGSGGYSTNPAVDGRPMYRGPVLTAPPFYIMDADKTLVTQAELDGLPVGTMLPNMITKGPSGERADIDAHGIYNPANNTWTLEMRRRLVTEGGTNDVQFDDLTREYFFGAAIFDNAQIEHSWTPAVFKLVFEPQ